MELRHATVLFGDLRGFSAILASSPPATVFEALNRWFVRMSEVADAQHGTIDSFIGDAIMVVFDDPKRGVACAVDMQIAMDDINRAHREAKLPEMYMGIGINSGEVIDGVFGSKLHSARTVIGEEVNLAARIEAFCLRGQILVSEATARECGDFAVTGPPMEVYIKGRRAGVALHEVHAIAPAGLRVPRQERRRSPRVPVRIAFAYQLLANDLVSQVRSQGMVVDLGYGGALVEMERELGLFEELRLELQLPFTGYLAGDLYGRVVNAKPHGEKFRCGVEFTSLGPETSRNIQMLVQLLIQGTDVDNTFPLSR